MSGPLTGIRVLDLSWILSGPFATMILGDLGAEVIKVEKPGVGDVARGNGPFLGDVSSYFLSLNRGKKSLTVDLSHPRGAEVVLGLAQHCDVLVENFVPGTMQRYGLDYERVRERNPRIIYASVSGFGQTGPYAHRPALDAIIQGMGGLMSLTGEEGGPPIRPGVSLGDIGAGLFACLAILACLEERHRSGQGQYIDISMLDCQVALLENAFARYFATGEVPRALGSRLPLFTPFQAFETKDGYVVVALVGSQWPLFCTAIDRLDLIDDPRFEDGWARTQHYQELAPLLTQAMKTKSTEQWLRELAELGIPCGPLNRIDQVAQDPQLAQRGMFVEVPHPGLGTVRVVNSPIKLSRTRVAVGQSCPGLGQHTRSILGELLGLPEEEIEALSSSGAI